MQAHTPPCLVSHRECAALVMAGAVSFTEASHVSRDSESSTGLQRYHSAEMMLTSDSWRRALGLYTLACEAGPAAIEPLLARARAYAAIGLWCVS